MRKYKIYNSQAKQVFIDIQVHLLHLLVLHFARSSTVQRLHFAHHPAVCLYVCLLVSLAVRPFSQVCFCAGDDCCVVAAQFLVGKSKINDTLLLQVSLCQCVCLCVLDIYIYHVYLQAQQAAHNYLQFVRTISSSEHLPNVVCV